MKKKIIINSILVGILAGIFSSLYRLTLEMLEKTRNTLLSSNNLKQVLLIIITMSLMGIIVNIFLKWQPLSSGSGIPQIQGENLGYVSMEPTKLLIAKFIGGMASNLGGLSLGREGPSIQIGGACGKIVSNITGKFFNNEKKEDKKLKNILLISAGASAGLAAAFNAPLAGTLFTLEEMHKKFTKDLLVHSLIASCISDFISKHFFGIKPVFSFELIDTIPLNLYIFLVFFGIFTSLGGVLFNYSIMFFLKVNDKLKCPNIVKRTIPFIFSIVIGLYSVRYLKISLLGGGHSLIENINQHPLDLYILIFLFFLKLLFTSISYGSGAQGGIFLPTLVLGGMMGCIFVNLMDGTGLISDIYYTNFIILGMVGYLTAVIRSPILSIVLVTEMTGKFNNLLPISLVCITSYAIAEILKCKPIYESLLERMIGKDKVK